MSLARITFEGKNSATVPCKAQQVRNSENILCQNDSINKHLNMTCSMASQASLSIFSFLDKKQKLSRIRKLDVINEQAFEHDMS